MHCYWQLCGNVLKLVSRYSSFLSTGRTLDGDIRHRCDLLLLSTAGNDVLSVVALLRFDVEEETDGARRLKVLLLDQ